MIIFKDSEESINGLAKIIAQEPTFPLWIKRKQKELVEYGSMAPDKKFIESQNLILQKAENIASQKIGYIFSINDPEDEKYMLYKKINNELIPIIKSFENSSEHILSSKELFDHLKKINLQKLITFYIHQSENFLYTHPMVREKEKWESDHEYKRDFIDYSSYHNPAKFNKMWKSILTDAGINLIELRDEEKEDFIKDLKQVTFVDSLKPLTED